MAGESVIASRPFVKRGATGALAPAMEVPGPLPLSLEDQQSHLGVLWSSSAPCPACGLSLQTGVAVYPCGHAFHAACEGLGVCPLCVGQTPGGLAARLGLPQAV